MSSVTKKGLMFVIAATLVLSALIPLGAFANVQATTGYLTPHDPIMIRGNDDVGQYSTSGDGTIYHPYYIENLDINGAGKTALYLDKTDVFVT